MVHCRIEVWIKGRRYNMMKKFIIREESKKEECSICHGQGFTTDHHDPCSECGGSGYYDQ